MKKTAFIAGEKAGSIRGKHLTIAVAACLIATSAAAFSTFFSFFLVPVSKALNIDRVSFSMTISIMYFTGMVSSIVWGQFMGKLGVRRVLLICCTIVTACLVGFSLSTNIILFYLLAAIMGLGTNGGTSLSAASLVTNWFEEKRGQVMAIVMACLSIGGVIGGFMLPAFIASNGWRMGFIITAVYFFVLTIPGGIFIVRSSPQQVGLLPFGAKQSEEARHSDEKHDSSRQGISFKEGMRSPAFYLLFIGIMLVGFPASFIQHLSAYGTDNGLTPETAGLLIVVSSVSGIILAIISGVINHKKGPLKTTIIYEFVFAVAFLAFFMVRGLVPMLIACIFFSFGLAFVSTMPSIIVGTIFGPKDFSKFLGLTSPAMAIGFILGVPLWGLIYESTHSYNLVFLICIICIILGALCISLCLKESKRLWAKLVKIS